MWPNKEHKFQEISTDRTRLRAAYIKEYTRFLTNEEPNFTPKLKEKYDVRKYAVYMDKERLFEKIYHRVNVLMKNPKAYSEVLETCNECLEKGYPAERSRGCICATASSRTSWTPSTWPIICSPSVCVCADRK